MQKLLNNQVNCSVLKLLNKDPEINVLLDHIHISYTFLFLFITSLISWEAISLLFYFLSSVTIYPDPLEITCLFLLGGVFVVC